jgi:hypothetical protein
MQDFDETNTSGEGPEERREALKARIAHLKAQIEAARRELAELAPRPSPGDRFTREALAAHRRKARGGFVNRWRGA